MATESPEPVEDCDRTMYFPELPHSHGERRSIFGDFTGGFNVTECTVQAQKCSQRQTKTSLAATEPCLPLTDPNIVRDVKDDCFSSLKTFHKDLYSAITSIKQSKSRISEQPTLQKKIKDHLFALKTGTSDHSSKFIKYISNSADTFQKAWPQTEFRLENTIYTGGALCSEQLPAAGNALLYGSGENLQNIYACLSKEDEQNLTVDEPQQRQTEKRIYQISMTCVHDRAFCMVRSKDECSLFDVSLEESSENFKILQKRVWPERAANPSFISCSPYIAGEALAVDSSGKIHLWNDSGERTVCRDMTHRFKCDSSSWRAHFGTNPRLLIVDDPTGVAIWDIRKAANKPGVDLFTLPHSSLHQRERVAVCKHYKDSYHLMACDYTLIMLDERFPNHSVLTWKTKLPGIPHYIDIGYNVLEDESQDVVAIASASPSETHCYPLSTAQGLPQGKGKLWKVCPIQDLLCGLESTDVFGERSRLQYRLNASLAGMAVLPWVHSKKTSILQMTVHGDIFSQTYEECKTELISNKTCSLFADNPDVKFSDHSKNVITEWARKAQQPYERKLTDRMFKVLPANFIKQNSVLRTTSCAVCNPATDAHPADGKYCLLCQNSFSCGRKMVDAIEKDKIIPSRLKNEEKCYAVNQLLGPLDEDQYQDPTSRLLLALWHGNEDVIQIVEEEIDERSNKLMAKKDGISDLNTGVETGLEPMRDVDPDRPFVETENHQTQSIINRKRTKSVESRRIKRPFSSKRRTISKRLNLVNCAGFLKTTNLKRRRLQTSTQTIQIRNPQNISITDNVSSSQGQLVVSQNDTFCLSSQFDTLDTAKSTSHYQSNPVSRKNKPLKKKTKKVVGGF